MARRLMKDKVAKMLSESLSSILTDDPWDGWNGRLGGGVEIFKIQFVDGFVIMACQKNGRTYELKLKPHSWTPRRQTKW